MTAPMPSLAAAGEAAVAEIVARFMRTFEIPGVGVAIVHADGSVHQHGYGVRALGAEAAVDADTQFAIASNSKAYLSACLALLVDENKLGWDDPVVRHLPEFRMYDQAVTAMMTVRDLLVHRSGLPLGAGDLMQFPRTDHSREDVLHALPCFKPAKGFRAEYAYDNCLYIVAGMLLERVSGMDWDAFVSQRIFAPLGMRDAVSNPTLVSSANRAGRHVRLGPPVIGMGPLERIEPDESAVLGPAGGISVSLAESVAWLQVQLARGALPNKRRLWSAAQAEQMWTPQIIIASGPGPTAATPQRSVMQGYALGWAVSDYRGQRMLTHGGGLAGQTTRTTLLPDLNIGFVVYANTGDNEPVSGLRYALLDHMLGVKGFDWLAATAANINEAQLQVVAMLGQGDFAPGAGEPSLALEGYSGRYRDPWYGDIVIDLLGQQLRINFTRTARLVSLLEPFGEDTFRTRFSRGTGEDAVIRFAVADGQVQAVTMAALSPLADFSFDYHDLSFIPVRNARTEGQR